MEALNKNIIKNHLVEFGNDIKQIDVLRHYHYQLSGYKAHLRGREKMAIEKTALSIRGFYAENDTPKTQRQIVAKFEVLLKRFKSVKSSVNALNAESYVRNYIDEISSEQFIKCKVPCSNVSNIQAFYSVLEQFMCLRNFL